MNDNVEYTGPVWMEIFNDGVSVTATRIFEDGRSREEYISFRSMDDASAFLEKYGLSASKVIDRREPVLHDCQDNDDECDDDKKEIPVKKDDLPLASAFIQGLGLGPAFWDNEVALTFTFEVNAHLDKLADIKADLPSSDTLYGELKISKEEIVDPTKTHNKVSDFVSDLQKSIMTFILGIIAKHERGSKDK